ncbi:hypothetical protein LTR22_000874 [Elasticomyces elasticus]|nr:hypothetical protein LTR22_000874 [Elasticomyces elasticus]
MASLSDSDFSTITSKDLEYTQQSVHSNASNNSTRSSRFMRARRFSPAPTATLSQTTNVYRQAPEATNSSFTMPKRDASVIVKRTTPRTRFISLNPYTSAHIKAHGLPTPVDEQAIATSLHLLKTRVSSLELENAEATKAAEESQQEIFHLRNQIRAGRQRSDSATGRDDDERLISQLKDQVTQLQASLSTADDLTIRAERKAAVSDIATKRITTERDAMVEQIAAAESKNEQLMKENEQLRKENDEFDAANREAYDINRNMNDEHDNLREIHRNMTDEHEDMCMEVEQLREQNQALKAKLAELSIQLSSDSEESLRQEIQTLKAPSTEKPVQQSTLGEQSLRKESNTSQKTSSRIRDYSPQQPIPALFSRKEANAFLDTLQVPVAGRNNSGVSIPAIDAFSFTVNDTELPSSTTHTQAEAQVDDNAVSFTKNDTKLQSSATHVQAEAQADESGIDSTTIRHPVKVSHPAMQLDYLPTLFTTPPSPPASGSGSANTSLSIQPQKLHVHSHIEVDYTESKTSGEWPSDLPQSTRIELMSPAKQQPANAQVTEPMDDTTTPRPTSPARITSPARTTSPVSSEHLMVNMSVPETAASSAPLTFNVSEPEASLTRNTSNTDGAPATELKFATTAVPSKRQAKNAQVTEHTTTTTKPIAETTRETFMDADITTSSGFTDDDMTSATIRPSQPPRVALMKVINGLEKEVTTLKSKLGEYQRRYQAMNPATSKRQRTIVRMKMEKALKDVENRSNQVYALHDVLAGQNLADAAIDDDLTIGQMELEETLTEMGFEIAEFSAYLGMESATYVRACTTGLVGTRHCCTQERSTLPVATFIAKIHGQKQNGAPADADLTMEQEDLEETLLQRPLENSPNLKLSSAYALPRDSNQKTLRRMQIGETENV